MARRFWNWGRTHDCTPSDFAEPGSEEDVVALVRTAADQQRRLKVVGAGHSWSDAAMTDGTLVSLDRMQELVGVDEKAGTVTVQAGMRLSQLNELLAERGLAVPILGSVAAQSVGGVLATGTHGSSLRWGNLSTLVTRMRLVTGTGEVLELEEGDERLAGARVALGALGVVTEVTLRVVPAFQLAEELAVVPFDEALDGMLEVAAAEEFAKWFWLPHTGVIAVYRYRKVDEPGEPSAFGAWLDRWVVNAAVFPAVLLLGGNAPGLVPALNGVVRKAYFKPGRRVGRSDRMFTLAMPPRHCETEWSVPAASGPEAIRTLDKLIEINALRVNFIQEFRFVKGDDAWLSPAHGRDSCHVGAYIGYGAHADRFIQGFCQAMQEQEARPHWGKQMGSPAEYLARVYPEMARFKALRDELDPKRVFDNAFLRRSLGE